MRHWCIFLDPFLLYLEIWTGRLPSLRSSRRKESSESKKWWKKKRDRHKEKGIYVYTSISIRRMTLTYKTILRAVDLVDSAIRHRWGSFSLLTPPHPAEGFPLNCRTKQTDEHSDYRCWWKKHGNVRWMKQKPSIGDFNVFTTNFSL